MTCFHLGQQFDARRHLETALARVRATPDLFPADDLYSFLGVHFEVNLLVYNQLAVWLLGDVAEALHMSETALELAQTAGHPYSQDYALGFTAIGRLFRGDTAAASAQLQMAARLSQEYGFVQWTAHEMILQGRTWVIQGRVTEGIDRMRQGLEGWQATGARLAKSYYLGLLAEGYAAAGRIDEGFAALDAAMAHAEAHHEGWWVAELPRLRGELLLRQGNLAAAEAAFERSLAIATAQKTRSLELRAITSLARLWQRQGKLASARRRLAECVAGFNTGFDAGDLAEANALLAQLSEKS
jgi:predicted ATPase